MTLMTGSPAGRRRSTSSRTDYRNPLSRSPIEARVEYLQRPDVDFQNRLDRSPFARNSPRLTKNTAAIRTGRMKFDELVMSWNRKIIQASSIILADLCCRFARLVK